jgi:hypothetical protein
MAAADDVMSFGSKVNSSDIDEGRPIFAFLPPNVVPGFYFVDANQPSGMGPGDIVYMHFGSGLFVKGDDIRITPFEIYPGGSQVKIGDTDFGYNLLPTPLVPKFFDVNGDGFYSFEDPIYLDKTVPGLVSSGDLRLTKSNLGYSAGSFVRDGDKDNGLLIAPFATDLRFSNTNGDVSTVLGTEIYDSGDNVYLDTTPPFVPPSSFTVVSVNDVRISI